MSTHTTVFPEIPDTIACPQILSIDWHAGTEYSLSITERVSDMSGGYAELRASILEHLAVYLLGPHGERFNAWRRLFGLPHAFLPVKKITLGFVSLPNRPHLLRFWRDETLIVRVTSFRYDELVTLNNDVQHVVKENGSKFISQGTLENGLTFLLSV